MDKKEKEFIPKAINLCGKLFITTITRKVQPMFSLWTN